AAMAGSVNTPNVRMVGLPRGGRPSLGAQAFPCNRAREGRDPRTSENRRGLTKCLAADPCGQRGDLPIEPESFLLHRVPGAADKACIADGSVCVAVCRGAWRVR